MPERNSPTDLIKIARSEQISSGKRSWRTENAFRQSRHQSPLPIQRWRKRHDNANVHSLEVIQAHRGRNQRIFRVSARWLTDGNKPKSPGSLCRFEAVKCAPGDEGQREFGSPSAVPSYVEQTLSLKISNATSASPRMAYQHFAGIPDHWPVRFVHLCSSAST